MKKNIILLIFGKKGSVGPVNLHINLVSPQRKCFVLNDSLWNITVTLSLVRISLYFISLNCREGSEQVVLWCVCLVFPTAGSTLESQAFSGDLRITSSQSIFGKSEAYLGPPFSRKFTFSFYVFHHGGRPFQAI